MCQEGNYCHRDTGKGSNELLSSNLSTGSSYIVLEKIFGVRFALKNSKHATSYLHVDL